jgi:very-short-patch-repair endonuclease
VIGRLVAAQHGVFTRLQAIETGLTEGMVRGRLAAGRWDRLHPGVYRLTGSPPTWRQHVMAVCLAWGPGSVISHRTAAALWRLAGFEQGLVELIVLRSRRRALPGIVHRPNALAPVDIATLDAIPLTSPARTLLDLAGVVPRDMVEEALDDALRRKLVSMSRLRWRLRETAGMGTPGAATIKALLDIRATDGVVPQSVFETKLLRALRAAGLPKPLIQHEVRDRGRLVGVVDFAYPDARLAIEAEGYRWHSGRGRFERDLARRNALTALDWRVIHVSWGDLAAPEKVMRTVAAALLRL